MLWQPLKRYLLVEQGANTKRSLAKIPLGVQSDSFRFYFCFVSKLTANHLAVKSPFPHLRKVLCCGISDMVDDSGGVVLDPTIWSAGGLRKRPRSEAEHRHLGDAAPPVLSKDPQICRVCEVKDFLSRSGSDISAFVELCI